MTSRHVTTGITLLVLSGLLVAGFLYGLSQLFAPVRDKAPVAVEPAPSCSPLEQGDRLRSKQVVVNVFNGTSREGLAGQTQESLSNRGFEPGSVGNAPTNNVRRVQVWIVKGEEAAGRLVALNFGPKTPVVTRRKSKDVSEGGVDVVIADGFKRLAKPRKSIVVRAAEEQVCASSSADASPAAS